jgi:hypothetical protein
MMPPAPIPPLA